MTVFDFLKNRLRQAREWLLDYAYWVTLGAMIAVIVGTALYTCLLYTSPSPRD